MRVLSLSFETEIQLCVYSFGAGTLRFRAFRRNLEHAAQDFLNQNSQVCKEKHHVANTADEKRNFRHNFIGIGFSAHSRYNFFVWLISVKWLKLLVKCERNCGCRKKVVCILGPSTTRTSLGSLFAVWSEYFFSFDLKLNGGTRARPARDLDKFRCVR